MDAMERLKRLKEITLDDGIFFALVLFAIGSCISGHLCKNSEMVAIALCAIRLLRGGVLLERFRVVRRLVFVLGIFYGTMTISALWGAKEGMRCAPNYAAMEWAFETLILFCTVLCVRSKKQVGVLYAALFLSLLVVDIYMLYQAFRGVQRPAGFFSRIGQDNAFFALIVPTLAVFAVDSNIGVRTRRACWGMLILGLVASILTGTRGMWIGVLLTLLVVFVYGVGSWKKGLQLMVGCVIVMTVVVFASPSLLNRITYERLSRDGSVFARIAMWEGAVNMFRDYPLLGVGMGNFNKYWREHYCPPNHPEWKKFDMPHSTSLLYLSEGGVPGIFGYAAFYGYLMAWSWKRRHTWRGLLLLGPTLSIFLYNLTDTQLASSHEPLRIFWFLIGLAFADEAITWMENKQSTEDMGCNSPPHKI